MDTELRSHQTGRRPFAVTQAIRPETKEIWHYHPEFELHYVVRGEGVRIVGNTVSNFTSGEIVFLGQQLPHHWNFISDPQETELIVLHFLPDFMGEHFLELPETSMLPELFERAKRGMIINGRYRDEITLLMRKAMYAENFDRAIVLLSILKLLSEIPQEPTIMPAEHVSYGGAELKTTRWNRVYEYTLANYHKKIKLADMASIGILNLTSFCRYFKMVAGISYNDFLTEIRLSHACRLLTENKLPTEIICYECGFYNISNFYRHFRKKLGMTPKEYKQRCLGNGLYFPAGNHSANTLNRISGMN